MDYVFIPSMSGVSNAIVSGENMADIIVKEEGTKE